MVKKNAFIAALLLFVSANSQSFAAIVTTIGSASVVQGSSGGFFNVPILVNASTATTERFGAYLGMFNVDGFPANGLRVFSDPQIGPIDPITDEPTFSYTLFNQPSMIGFNGFKNAVTDAGLPSTLFVSNGLTAELGLEALTNVPVTSTGGILAFLQVSTNLPVGSYQLVGTVDSASSSGADIVDIVVPGTFTVTAVPEPSTFALLIVVGLSGVAIRRLRRSKSVVVR